MKCTHGKFGDFEGVYCGSVCLYSFSVSGSQNCSIFENLNPSNGRACERACVQSRFDWNCFHFLSLSLLQLFIPISCQVDFGTGSRCAVQINKKSESSKFFSRKKKSVHKIHGERTREKIILSSPAASKGFDCTELFMKNKRKTFHAKPRCKSWNCAARERHMRGKSNCFLFGVWKLRAWFFLWGTRRNDLSWQHFFCEFQMLSEISIEPKRKKKLLSKQIQK